MAAELRASRARLCVILAAGTLARRGLVSPVLRPCGRSMAWPPTRCSRRSAATWCSRPSRPASATPHHRSRAHLLVPAPAGRVAGARPTGVRHARDRFQHRFGRPVRTAPGRPGRRTAEVLVTVGRGIEPGELGAQPGHIRVEQYVDQADVLPTCGSRLVARWLRQRDGRTRPRLALGADTARCRPAPQREKGRRGLGVAAVLDAASVTPEGGRAGRDRDARRRGSSRASACPEGRDRRAARGRGDSAQAGATRRWLGWPHGTAGGPHRRRRARARRRDIGGARLADTGPRPRRLPRRRQRRRWSARHLVDQSDGTGRGHPRRRRAPRLPRPPPGDVVRARPLRVLRRAPPGRPAAPRRRRHAVPAAPRARARHPLGGLLRGRSARSSSGSG